MVGISIKETLDFHWPYSDLPFCRNALITFKVPFCSPKKKKNGLKLGVNWPYIVQGDGASFMTHGLSPLLVYKGVTWLAFISYHPCCRVSLSIGKASTQVH